MFQEISGPFFTTSVFTKMTEYDRLCAFHKFQEEMEQILNRPPEEIYKASRKRHEEKWRLFCKIWKIDWKEPQKSSSSEKTSTVKLELPEVDESIAQNQGKSDAPQVFEEMSETEPSLFLDKDVGDVHSKGPTATSESSDDNTLESSDEYPLNSTSTAALDIKYGEQMPSTESVLFSDGVVETPSFDGFPTDTGLSEFTGAGYEAKEYDWDEFSRRRNLSLSDDVSKVLTTMTCDEQLSFLCYRVAARRGVSTEVVALLLEDSKSSESEYDDEEADAVDAEACDDVSIQEPPMEVNGEAQDEPDSALVEVEESLTIAVTELKKGATPDAEGDDGDDADETPAVVDDADIWFDSPERLESKFGVGVQDSTSNETRIDSPLTDFSDDDVQSKTPKDKVQSLYPDAVEAEPDKVFDDASKRTMKALSAPANLLIVLEVPRAWVALITSFEGGTKFILISQKLARLSAKRIMLNSMNFRSRKAGNYFKDFSSLEMESFV